MASSIKHYMYILCIRFTAGIFYGYFHSHTPTHLGYARYICIYCTMWEKERISSLFEDLHFILLFTDNCRSSRWIHQYLSHVSKNWNRFCINKDLSVPNQNINRICGCKKLCLYMVSLKIFFFYFQ